LALEDGPASGQLLETFSVITTEPNPMVAAVHHRMPVILGHEHYLWWLQTGFEPQHLKTLFPYPAKDMACYRDSKFVNNAKHDSPVCAAGVISAQLLQPAFISINYIRASSRGCYDCYGLFNRKNWLPVGLMRFR